MYGLFTKILNMCLSASYLVLAILLVRVVFRRLPKKYICLLWLLVAIRLVCPISISSSFSAFNLIGATTGEKGQMEYLRHSATDSYHNWFISIPELTSDGIYLKNEIDVSVEKNSGFPKLLVGGWLAGIGVMGLFAVVSYIRIRRETGASLCVDDNVYICDEISSPFVLGTIRPRIYIPSGTGASAYQYILAHEKAHLKRLDHIWKPLGYVLLSIYWFNPLLWIAYILLVRDIETACDEQVVAGMDKENRAAYSETLLAFAAERRRITACPVAFGENSVKTRVKAVLKYKKPAVWIGGAAVLLCGILTVTLLTNPKADAMSPHGNNYRPIPTEIPAVRSEGLLPNNGVPVPTSMPTTEWVVSVADVKGITLDGKITSEGKRRANRLFESDPSFFRFGFALIDEDCELWAYDYNAPRDYIYERCEFRCAAYVNNAGEIFAKSRKLKAGAYEGYYFINKTEASYSVYFWGNSREGSTFARAKAGDCNEALHLIMDLYGEHTDIFDRIPENDCSIQDVEALYEQIILKRAELSRGTAFSEFGISHFKFSELEYAAYGGIASDAVLELIDEVASDYRNSFDYCFVEMGEFISKEYRGKYVVGFNECRGVFRVYYYLDNGSKIANGMTEGYYLDLMTESFQKYADMLGEE